MSRDIEASTITRFAPPLDCFDPNWKLPPVGQDTRVNSLILGGGLVGDLPDGQPVEILPTTTFSSAPFAVVKGVTPSCFPSSDKSDGTPLDVGWGCPWGYDAFSTITSDPSSKTTMCCPTFMGNKDDYQQGRNSMADANMSRAIGPKGNPTVYEGTACQYWYEGNPAYGLNMPITGSMGPNEWRVVTFFHSPLQMKWNAKEPSPTTSFMMATPMTAYPTPTAPAFTTSSAPAPAHTSTATPSSKGMSLKEKVGIAVGVAVATTLLSAFVIWFVLHRRRKRNHAMIYELPSDLNRSEDEKAELEEDGSGNLNSIHELASPTVASKAELASNWHGTEAPALVEVDLSRPIWEKEAGDAESLEKSSSPTENPQT